jgi:hypothetical protein
MYSEAHSENEVLKQKLYYIQQNKDNDNNSPSKDSEIEKLTFKNLDLIEEIKE